MNCKIWLNNKFLNLKMKTNLLTINKVDIKIQKILTSMNFLKNIKILQINNFNPII